MRFPVLIRMKTDQLSISVNNIGGIDETEQSFEPGITVLSGRNATNRTSFLQALMAAFGSNRASLKADADEGSVELTLDGVTYSRTLSRTNGRVSYGGEPYLEDAEMADLFAFLTETNEARLAIPRGDDLRDIIMRPVDTAAIQAEIRELEQEKHEIDSDIEEIESLKNKVPQLQERLAKREQEIEEKEAELSEKEAELEDLDKGLEETRDKKSKVDEVFDALREARQELEDLQYQLETEQESLSSLEEEREELESAWEELDTASDSRVAELEAELEQLRSQKQAVESEISTLLQVAQFNEEMLEGASADIANVLRADGGASTDSVTGQLVGDSEVVCWTCGSRVEESAIEDTLEDLRSLLREKHETVRDLDTDIGEIKEQKDEVESARQRAEELSRRRRDIEDEIERRTETVDSIEEQIDTQSVEIERLEAEAEAVEDESYSEILEAHKKANQLEFELDRLRKETTDIQNELAEVKDQLGCIDDLEQQREAVVSDLQELRTKIDRLEEGAVDAFNEHMAEILDILEYENIERIWLERTATQVRNGRRKEEKTIFDIHIVRSMAGGTTYEDTVEHLSESEREVTGLLFALAGYLVHDVHQRLPVMLLDSLEAIDSNRIASLIEYFVQYVDYLIVVLLPEDASAIDGQHRTVTEF